METLNLGDATIDAKRGRTKKGGGKTCRNTRVTSSAPAIERGYSNVSFRNGTLDREDHVRLQKERAVKDLSGARGPLSSAKVFIPTRERHLGGRVGQRRGGKRKMKRAPRWEV